MCSPCRKSIHKVASSLKRINALQDKLSILSPVLSNKTKTDAYSKFEHIFNPTQKSFLKILLDRYYDHTTLAAIGKEYNVSREYVRQCQDKAVQILFDHRV
jgi:DNA-directed RNA polymerase sigma subunit (sigma70/sigma32)